MPNPTAIRNKKYMQQIKDFGGMRFGKIMPTDIDAFLDFNDKIFILIELKYDGHSMPRGQELALERLSDACWTDTRESYVIVATHHSGADEDISVSDANVIRVRWHKRWYSWRDKNETVRGLVDRIRLGMKIES